MVLRSALGKCFACSKNCLFSLKEFGCLASTPFFAEYLKNLIQPLCKIGPSNTWVFCLLFATLLGAFSGFFGGLSGHQGALRSMFLIKRMKEIKEFVATTAFISLATDIARNSVYWTTLNWRLVDFTQLLIVSMGSILGVFLGTYLLKKITLHLIQYLVAVGLFFLGLSITIGLI